jgi:hypothetical protein
MDAFMVLAMLWAVVNAIPPLLCIVYFFTKGWLLRWACHLGQLLGLLLGVGQPAGGLTDRIQMYAILPADMLSMRAGWWLQTLHVVNGIDHFAHPVSLDVCCAAVAAQPPSGACGY